MKQPKLPLIEHMDKVLRLMLKSETAALRVEILALKGNKTASALLKQHKKEVRRIQAVLEDFGL